MRIGQTSFIVFVSKLVSSVLGFFATLYFARLLGAQVLGYYALTLVVTKWIKLGGDIGIASAVTKRISEGDEPSAYFTAGLTAVAGFGFVSSIALFVFRDVVNGYIGVDVTLLLIVLVVVGLFSSLMDSALQGERLVHISGILSPLRLGVRSLIQIALVFVGFGLIGMLLGYAAGLFVIGLVSLFFLTVRIKRPRLEHFRSLLHFAKFSWLGSLRGRSFNDVDVLVLGALVSQSLVGVYSVAWSLTSFIGVFGSSIRKTTFPELSHADADGHHDQFANVVSDSLAYSGLIAIPGFFGAFILADRILRIYGDQFTRGGAVLGLLILAMLLYDYQSQLLNGLNALDRPDLAFRVNVAFIGANFALNIVLVLLIGWEGAAVATVLAAGIGLTVAFLYIRRLLDFDIPYAEFGRQLTAALVMTGVVVVVRALVEPIFNHNVILVTVLVTLGAGIYFLCLLAISRRFRSTVADNSPVPIPFVS